MYKFIVGPAIFGLLAFLITFFIAPLFVSETDIVAGVAAWTIDLSNRHFANMPPVVASYVANLNLALVALSAGMLLTIIVLFLVIIGALFAGFFRGIRFMLQKLRKQEVVRDLPPIDLDPRYRDSKTEKKILGRGFDAEDRDR